MNKIALGIVGIGTQANPPLIRVIPPDRSRLFDAHGTSGPPSACPYFPNGTSINAVVSGVDVCDGTGDANGVYIGTGYYFDTPASGCVWYGNGVAMGQQQYSLQVYYFATGEFGGSTPYWWIFITGPGTGYGAVYYFYFYGDATTGGGPGPFTSGITFDYTGACNYPATFPIAGANGSVTLGFV